MTDKPRAPEAGGAAPKGSGSAGDPVEGKAGPGVVIRNNRKISLVEAETDAAVEPADVAAGTADAVEAADAATDATDVVADTTDDAAGMAEEEAAEAESGPSAEGLVETAEVEVDEVGETVALDEPVPATPPVVDAPAEPADGGAAGGGGVALGAELEALRAELDERTRDLQRVTAEYANYRKRVERDRGIAAEQTIGTVLAALLPVLDDLDRAREHGDLVGPFGTVAEQLTVALGKFGLTAFGERGEPFDPTRHEAVAHETSAEVTEPTCVQIMRRGYLLGDRLLRPALVGVADPE